MFSCIRASVSSSEQISLLLWRQFGAQQNHSTLMNILYHTHSTIIAYILHFHVFRDKNQYSYSYVSHTFHLKQVALRFCKHKKVFGANTLNWYSMVTVDVHLHIYIVESKMPFLIQNVCLHIMKCGEHKLVIYVSQDSWRTSLVLEFFFFSVSARKCDTTKSSILFWIRNFNQDVPPFWVHAYMFPIALNYPKRQTSHGSSELLNER